MEGNTLSGTKGKSGVYPKSEAHRAKIRATMKRKGIRPPKYKKRVLTDEQILENGVCPECLSKLPSKKLEQRDGGYYEFVSVCESCGATYVG